MHFKLLHLLYIFIIFLIMPVQHIKLPIKPVEPRTGILTDSRSDLIFKTMVYTHHTCIPFQGKTSPLSIKLFLDKKQSLLSEIFWPTNKAQKWGLSYTTIPDVPGTIPFHCPAQGHSRWPHRQNRPEKNYNVTSRQITFRSFEGKELRFHTYTAYVMVIFVVGSRWASTVSHFNNS